MSNDRTSPVAPGELVAEKYLVEHVLGAGAMGVVVAATHLDLAQRVAIKFLSSNTPGHVERFVREARATVRLRSEHAARVYDVGTIPDGTPFMVLELLEGHDLDQLIRAEAPLPVARAADYLIQICEAVAEAHALGIVHRDIKPQNLFLTLGVAGEAVIKVLDFGIAKSIEAEGANALTQTSSLMGSPMYMSPETMRSAKNVLPQNDIWALGVVLQELLTQKLPFDGDSFPELCLKVVHEPARSPLEDRPDLPVGLVAIIARCLAKDPADRFATAADLATALEPFAPPESRFVAERARQLTAQAATKGIIRTSPTLPSVVFTPTTRGISSAPPVSVRLPAPGPLPPLGEQTIGLAGTANEHVLDNPPSSRLAPPAGNQGPWILASVAVVCMTVVVGGALILSRRERPTTQPAPQTPTLSGAVTSVQGLPVSLPPAASEALPLVPSAAPSARTLSASTPLPSPISPPAIGAGPGNVKTAKSAAPKPAPPAVPAPGDEIPNLR